MSPTCFRQQQPHPTASEALKQHPDFQDLLKWCIVCIVMWSLMAGHAIRMAIVQPLSGWSCSHCTPGIAQKLVCQWTHKWLVMLHSQHPILGVTIFEQLPLWFPLLWSTLDGRNHAWSVTLIVRHYDTQPWSQSMGPGWWGDLTKQRCAEVSKWLCRQPSWCTQRKLRRSWRGRRLKFSASKGSGWWWSGWHASQEAWQVWQVVPSQRWVAKKNGWLKSPFDSWLVSETTCISLIRIWPSSEVRHVRFGESHVTCYWWRTSCDFTVQPTGKLPVGFKKLIGQKLPIVEGRENWGWDWANWI